MIYINEAISQWILKDCPHQLKTNESIFLCAYIDNHYDVISMPL